MCACKQLVQNVCKQGKDRGRWNVSRHIGHVVSSFGLEGIHSAISAIRFKKESIHSDLNKVRVYIVAF